MYDTTSGTVSIDNKDIKDLNLFDLRNQISVVPQDAFLFSDILKITSNLVMKMLPDEEVMEAAKKAVVHDNIMNFNQQYETVLGERGITLSGGQSNVFLLLDFN